MSGKLYDIDMGNPVSNAVIEIRSQNAVVESDRIGEFSLTSPKKKITLRIHHVAYRDTSLILDLRSLETDSIRIAIPLAFEVYEIPTAEISDVQLPDTVFGSKEYHVADFTFLDQKLLLLTYEKEDRWKRQEHVENTMYHGTKLVLFDGEDELHSRSLSAEGQSFYTDYLNDRFLVTNDGVFQIDLENDKLRAYEIEDEEFSKIIIPVFDTLKFHMLYSNWSAHFPAFEYYAYDPADSSHTLVSDIQDDLQMELLRSEYKYLDTRSKLQAYRMELKTGVDKEYIAAQMTGFSNSLYAEPVYAPCFVLRDTILIFNHLEDKLEKRDVGGKDQGEVAIYYHNDSERKHWEKMLIHDDVKDKIYSLYQRNGFAYLKEVNLDTGVAEKVIRLSYRYPENIKVHNDKVYYIYRPFESPQKRFLYSEDILTVQ